MKYAHVIQYVAATPWAILPSKMEELLSVLAFRAAGHLFTAEEIQARIGESSTSPDPSKRGAIAVIPLRGVIAHRMGTMDDASGGMSAERFTAMLNAAVADPNVATILIDCDSPGGTVPGVPEAADAVFAARDSKRVVAIANSTMASAAYWIASQANEVVAIPSALNPSIGSIGAFYVHQDVSAALEKEGVKVTLISAGKYKTEGNPFEPMTDEYRARLQTLADAGYDAFVKAVARGRGVTPAAVRGGYGEGRALSAKDAKAAGLIDRIATMDETIARLAGRKTSGGMSAAAESPEGETTELPAIAAEAPLVAMDEEQQLAVDEDLRRRIERV
jgi:signal peptide peptidase SppA